MSVAFVKPAFSLNGEMSSVASCAYCGKGDHSYNGKWLFIYLHSFDFLGCRTATVAMLPTSSNTIHVANNQIMGESGTTMNAATIHSSKRAKCII